MPPMPFMPDFVPNLRPDRFADNTLEKENKKREEARMENTAKGLIKNHKVEEYFG